MTTKALFFTPYAFWNGSTLAELIMARELEELGLKTQFLCCDALFSDCDVAWKVKNPRSSQTCTKCLERNAVLFQKMERECHWLSRYVSQEERERSLLWEEELSNEALENAQYQEMPLGQWCRYSVQRHLGINFLDTKLPEVEEVYRSYLRSACLALDSIDNALEYQRPDICITYGGNYFVQRIFLELCWSRGIRTFAYDQGWVPDSLAFWENDVAHGFLETLALYNQWKDAPLQQEELRVTHEFLAKREKAFLIDEDTFSERIIQLRKLGLTLDKRLITFFITADDYVSTEEGTDIRLKPLMALQEAIEYYRHSEEFELLIRLDPSVDSQTEISRNFMRDFQRDCVQDLPSNAAVIWPQDTLDPYFLIKLSERCIMYSSLLAIDAAVRGRPVMVQEPNCPLSHNFTCNFHTKSSPRASLKAFSDWKPHGDQLRTMVRDAYRAAYHYSRRVSLPFPPVSPEGQFPIQGNLDAIDYISSTTDNTFRQLYQAIIHRSPVYPRADPSLLSHDEEQFFAGIR